MDELWGVATTKTKHIFNANQRWIEAWKCMPKEAWDYKNTLGWSDKNNPNVKLWLTLYKKMCTKLGKILYTKTNE